MYLRIRSPLKSKNGAPCTGLILLDKIVYALLPFLRRYSYHQIILLTK